MRSKFQQKLLKYFPFVEMIENCMLLSKNSNDFTWLAGQSCVPKMTRFVSSVVSCSQDENGRDSRGS